MSGIESVVRELVAWVHVLVSLAGVMVCVLNLRRSRFMWLLLGGFVVEAGVSVCYRITTYLIGHNLVAYTSISLVMLGISVVGLAGAVAVVGGVAAVLADPSLETGPPQ